MSSGPPDPFDGIFNDDSLLGDVMFALKVARATADGKKRHELGLRLRGTGTHRLASGRAVKYVEEAGICIPERPGITATIGFVERTDAGNLFEYIQRDDENWGIIFASADEVNQAYDRFTGYFNQLKSHIIDMKAVCPQAQIDRISGLWVSVEGFWEYFKRFNYHTLGKIGEHYHSTDFENEFFSFVPGIFKISEKLRQPAGCPKRKG